MPNPTVEEALAICQQKVDEGVDGKPYEPDVVQNMKDRHHGYFERRFQHCANAWEHESTLVLDSSLKVGRLARAISDILQKSTIEEVHVVHAVRIVGADCKALIERVRARVKAAKDDGDCPRYNYCPDGGDGS